VSSIAITHRPKKAAAESGIIQRVRKSMAALLPSLHQNTSDDRGEATQNNNRQHARSDGLIGKRGIQRREHEHKDADLPHRLAEEMTDAYPVHAERPDHVKANAVPQVIPGNDPAERAACAETALTATTRDRAFCNQGLRYNRGVPAR
jgi:hypothetical protein